MRTQRGSFYLEATWPLKLYKNLPFFPFILQSIPHAAAAFVVCLQNPFVHETLDFTEGGVVACVEKGGRFFCGEGLGEAACHDFIDELLFAGAERVVCVGAAELDAADFRSEKSFAVLDGVSHHLQEP